MTVNVGRGHLEWGGAVALEVFSDTEALVSLWQVGGCRGAHAHDPLDLGLIILEMTRDNRVAKVLESIKSKTRPVVSSEVFLPQGRYLLVPITFAASYQEVGPPYQVTVAVQSHGPVTATGTVLNVEHLCVAHALHIQHGGKLSSSYRGRKEFTRHVSFTDLTIPVSDTFTLTFILQDGSTVCKMVENGTHRPVGYNIRVIGIEGYVGASAKTYRWTIPSKHARIVFLITRGAQFGRFLLRHSSSWMDPYPDPCPNGIFGTIPLGHLNGELEFPWPYNE